MGEFTLDIRKLTKFNEKVIKEIREVEGICKNHDGVNGSLFLDTSMNFHQDIKSIFLLYKDNRLVSLLTMFIPMNEEAEISAYTLPEYRRKGYFKRLLEEAIEEVKKYHIPYLMFICEPESNDGLETIKKLNAELDFTEYSLRYNNPSSEMKIENVPNISLQRAEQNDLDGIISLSQEVFNDDYEVAKSIITKTLEANNRVQYVAKLEGKPIGIGSVSFENNEASIFGVGVSPKYQGKGFGRELIMLIINELKRKGIENIMIEVDSLNERAFKLYKSCGFQVEASFHYFRKSVS